MTKPFKYRCRHAVEAMRWQDTDANREAFAQWFEDNDAMFETRGPVVVLPDGGEVIEGGPVEAALRRLAGRVGG